MSASKIGSDNIDTQRRQAGLREVMVVIALEITRESGTQAFDAIFRQTESMYGALASKVRKDKVRLALRFAF